MQLSRGFVVIRGLGVLSNLNVVLEGALPDPIRAEIVRRLAELVKEQFQLVQLAHIGFVPDENGERPVDVAAITESVTKRVIEEFAGVPAEFETSELEPEADEDEADEEDIEAQIEDLNSIDESDEEVSLIVPAEIVAPKVITIPADIAALLRAALKANLNHVVIKVVSVLLQEN